MVGVCRESGRLIFCKLVQGASEYSPCAFHLQELCRVLCRVVEGRVTLPSQASFELLVPVHLHLHPNLQPHDPPPNLNLQVPPPAPPPSPTHQLPPAPSHAGPQHCLFTRSLCNFLPSCTGGSSCGWDSLDAERPPQMGGSRYTARRHHTPTPTPPHTHPPGRTATPCNHVIISTHTHTHTDTRYAKKCTHWHQRNFCYENLAIKKV